MWCMELFFRILLLLSFSALALCQFSPDCDVEWSNQALEIISRKEGDPRKLQHIHAILQSCNKAQLQKVAEVSIFLLEKGTYPNPKIMQEMSKLAEDARDRKLGRMLKLKSELPEHLHQAIGRLATVAANGSLSGNEKAIVMARIVQALDESDRSQIEHAIGPAGEGRLDLEYGPSPTLSKLPGSIAAPTAPPKPQVTESRQFSMNGPESGSRQIFTGFGSSPSFIAPAMPSSAVLRPQIPFKANFISNFEKEDKDKDEAAVSEFFKEPDEDDEEPILLVGKRPLSVGTAADKNLQPIIPVTHATTLPSNIPDPDLMTPKPSMWNEAAKLLQESTNIPNKIGKFIDEAVKHPEKLAMKLGESLRRGADAQTEDHKSWLPARRSDQPPIVPVNQPASTFQALNSFDTKVDRFASTGPINRFVIGQPTNANSGTIPGFGLPNFPPPALTLNPFNPFQQPQPQPQIPLQNAQNQWLAAQMSQVGIPGLMAPNAGGLLSQPHSGISQSALQTAQMFNKAYSFPAPNVERGQKYLQNLPAWSPMPQAPFSKMNAAKTYETYPDFRQGLFPAIEGQGIINIPPRESGERESAKYRSGIFVHDINRRIDHTDNTPNRDLKQFAGPDDVVSIESYPQNPGFKLPEKQLIGDDLSETDPKGSVPMGRYGKESYETETIRPPILYETTTVVAVPYTRAEVWKVDKLEPRSSVIRPYEPGPERFTGSFSGYNHAPRNMKLDINPIQSVVG